jgi:uncharacterized protein YjbI with pentapeptide repeats
VSFAESRLSDVNLRNADLRGADFQETELSGVDFSGANLQQARFTNIDFESPLSFRGIDARGARFMLADLSEADFSGADLSWTIFRNARLCGADFCGANLSVADLRSTDLAGANFAKAIFSWTVLGDVDLSQCGNLDRVEHQRPSTIGLDVIYRSQGRISETFLRGAGAPDSLITFMTSLAGRAIEFYSCFISYSSKDQEFAGRLHDDLQKNGVRCWFAPHDVQAGRKLHEQIDEAIRLYDRLLLILSEHSMSSEWVKSEIANARQKELRQKRRVLFPIRLAPFELLRGWTCFDTDTGKDSAREVREYFIPDFSTWKDAGSYQKALQRLLKDLKADARRQS